MKELIKITEQNGNRAVSARELHGFLEVKSKFAEWINRRIEEYGFIEGQDFSSFSEISEKPNGGRPTTEYAISINMAKELSMVERNEKGKLARLYFIEMEKRATQKELSVSDYPNQNKILQAELFSLIKANLFIGDVTKIARENGFNRNTVNSVVQRRSYSPEIIKVLYEKALENKSKRRAELEEMISVLKA
ncbi:antA/AntB antirepressor family protein [Capnocytophaga sp. ARDL2]|uniref:antA/AntB antirepressor family protein n=1 Tax=Capnocytophaga sp. ARDL2 TaxID=3238809 RepID=UPI003557CD5C